MRFWKRGYVSGEDVGRKSRRLDGYVPTKELHVFEFHQAPGLREGIGTLAPACRSRSEHFIVADVERRLDRAVERNLDRCGLCEEELSARSVSVQEGEQE